LPVVRQMETLHELQQTQTEEISKEDVAAFLSQLEMAFTPRRSASTLAIAMTASAE